MAYGDCTVAARLPRNTSAEEFIEILAADQWILRDVYISPIENVENANTWNETHIMHFTNDRKSKDFKPGSRVVFVIDDVDVLVTGPFEVRSIDWPSKTLYQIYLRSL